jgi:hypothetical protein
MKSYIYGVLRTTSIAILRCPRTVPVMTTTLDDRQLPLTPLAAAVDAEHDSLARLATIHRLRTALAAVESTTVKAARAEGATWSAVGDRLDISKQAASKRFRNSVNLESQDPGRVGDHRPKPSHGGWEIAIPGRRALLHIRPRGGNPR